MDPNANANAADLSQGDPAAAANPTNPGADLAAATANGDTNQPADPVNDGDSGFDPEIQKFLDNQNIKVDDPKAAIVELAKRNMELRGKQNPAPEVGAKAISDVLSGTDNAPVPKVEDTPAPAPKQVPTVQPTSRKGPSDMEIATVSVVAKQQYPDVSVDAQFYRDMLADGFQPVSNDGSIKLQSVLNYAAYKQKLSDAEKAIASQNPQAGSIPEPSNKVDYADVTTADVMTESAAQNIVMFDAKERRYGRPGHPQLNEAVKFLQDNAFKS